MIKDILQNLNWTEVSIAIISLLGLCGIVLGVQNNNKQVQKSGNNCKNVQINGNIDIKGNINEK